MSALVLPSLALLWSTGLGGCLPASSPVEPETQRYLRVVEDPAISREQGLALCEGLDDADLQGDCLLALAQHEIRRGGEPTAVCAAMERGLWQDECWFEAAEAAARRRDKPAAAALCLKAGRFVDDCGQHLWQGALRATIAPLRREDAAPVGREGPVPSFEEALPRARLVYAAWAPLLEEGTDMKERFWRRFYQNGFERRGFIDLGRCAALDEADRVHCRRAGVQLFEGRVATDLAAARIPLCATTDMDAAIGQALRAWPDPELEAALDRQRDERCGPRPAADGG